MKRKYLLGIITLITSLVIYLFFFKSSDWYKFLLKRDVEHSENKKNKQSINLFIWDGNFHRKIAYKITLPEDSVLQLQHSIQAWFTTCQEKRIIPDTVVVEHIIFSRNNNELFVEVNHLFFDKNMSIFEKVQIIEALAHTISGISQNIKKLYLMHNDKFLEDDHLDFTQGWVLINQNKLSSFID